MITDPISGTLRSALQDFRSARSQADLQEMLARLKGEANQLLSYDEVRKKLGLHGSTARGLQDIALDAIVGSVGRYTDFTRDFLPRREINPERWARVKIGASGMVGLPPIQVYKIGEAFFVEDGNHRVSVARQLGATHIQAYVNEVFLRAPLTPEVKADDLIMIAEYNHFLEETHLDELRPEADLRVTVPGKYPLLLEHIAVHRYYMGLEHQREIPYQEAVTHWYDTVYQPIARIIHEQSVLHRFPERTETDLYIWIAEHLASIEKELGWKIPNEYASHEILTQLEVEKQGIFAWVGDILGGLIPSGILESGPPAGKWREIISNSRDGNRLFVDILVPVNGRQEGWYALEEAILFATRESSNLHGLYVVKTDARKQSLSACRVKAKFEKRCQEAGINGQLTIAVSDKIAEEISQWAGFTDLVVINLTHPPSAGVLARLNSGFRELILRCPRPILAVPQTTRKLERALLAYDGSPKAKEALYLAAYLAEKWQIPLVVLTIADNIPGGQEILQEAHQYLEAFSLEVVPLLESGPAGETILRVSQEQDCDLLLMGGYGRNPVMELVLGSAIDRVLRESRQPVLICR